MRMQIVRYGLNGIFATFIHYLVLCVCIDLLHFYKAGVANLVASSFGITASFIGNKYYVFREINAQIYKQATTFVALYICIALLHGLTLYVWSDVLLLSYHIGFLIAVCIQFALGYYASKYYVFVRR